MFFFSQKNVYYGIIFFCATIRNINSLLNQKMQQDAIWTLVLYHTLRVVITSTDSIYFYCTKLLLAIRFNATQFSILLRSKFRYETVQIRCQMVLGKICEYLAVVSVSCIAPVSNIPSNGNVFSHKRSI